MPCGISGEFMTFSSGKIVIDGFSYSIIGEFITFSSEKIVGDGFLKCKVVVTC